MKSRRSTIDDSLLDCILPGIDRPAELPGETAQQPDRERLEGQYERVISLMSDGNWHTLPQLSIDLKRKFRQLYSETSISARLRQMRCRGWIVHCERSRPGSGLFQYRAFNPVTHTVCNGQVMAL